MRLVIETAGLACSVALFDDACLVAAIHRELGRGHAEHLLPMIASLPGGGRSDAILVDCGPGSFTGVRVGVAAARGLALGWSARVSGYSALALLAAQNFAATDVETVTVAIPGGHGEMFVQRFARAPLAAMTPLRSCPLAMIEADDLHLPGNAALDARTTPLLDRHFAMLPPVPIYGRGADATPMA